MIELLSRIRFNGDVIKAKEKKGLIYTNKEELRNNFLIY